MGTDDTYTPIDLVMAALKFDLADAFKWLSQKTGWSQTCDLSIIAPVPARQKTPKAAIAPVAAVEPIDDVPEFADFDEFDEVNPVLATVEMGTYFPVHPKVAQMPATAADFQLQELSVPGLVGDIVRGINAGAEISMPAMFLGAALTVVSTLMGRVVAPPRADSDNMNLYAAGSAPSGFGKGRPLGFVNRIMSKTQFATYRMSPKIKSNAHFGDLLYERPVSLLVLDELGAEMRQMNEKNASSHMQAFNKSYRELFNTNAFDTDGSRTKRGETIYSPQFNVFGVTTPEEFQSALSGDQKANGFFSRWLIIQYFRNETKIEKPLEDDTQEFEEIKYEINRRIAAMTLEQVEDQTNPAKQVEPRHMRWPGVDLSKALKEKIAAIQEADPATQDAFQRVTEIAIRVACVITWGENPDAEEINPKYWEFASDWTLRQFQRSHLNIVQAAEKAIDPRDFVTFRNAVTSYLWRHGKTATARDLFRGPLQNAQTKTQKDVLESLENSEIIVKSFGVRNKVIYTLS
jgi:hypothetical protein